MADATPGPLSRLLAERQGAGAHRRLPYCYLRLQTPGRSLGRGPEAKVEKGTEVTVINPMLMSNFESKTLNRTFAEILRDPGQCCWRWSSRGTGGRNSCPHGRPAPPVLIDKVDKAAYGREPWQRSGHRRVD